ncbi:hypothetical protein RHGRI_033384 [Rhododendron griersonianum]|uniref:CCHC-type domain-containing protein n=1 Tax=Rhododendron griersonianum TaxID=479676 RepID=A0AAV6HWH3_9ERIC|nr:hypothetical protein RHGRI_033384 [Rhododendron griersonianum]
MIEYYVGGTVSFIDYCDNDRISRTELHAMCKEVGYVEELDLFYKVCGLDEKWFFKKIQTDNDVTSMVESLQNDLVEVYIEDSNLESPAIVEQTANVDVEDGLLDIDISNWEWDGGVFLQDTHTVVDLATHIPSTTPNPPPANEPPPTTKRRQARRRKVYHDSDFETDNEVFIDSDYNLSEDDDALFDENVDEDVEWCGVRKKKRDRTKILHSCLSETESEEGDSSDGFLSFDSSSDEDREDRPKYRKYRPVIGKVQPIIEDEMIFKNRAQCVEAIRQHAIVNGKAITFEKNDTDRVRAHCVSHCPWHILASSISSIDRKTLQVKTFNPNHIQCGWNWSNKLLNSSWLARTYFKEFKIKPSWPVTEIVEQVRGDFNVKISNGMAYNARRKAVKTIEGSYFDQYEKYILLLIYVQVKLLKTGCGILPELPTWGGLKPLWKSLRKRMDQLLSGLLSMNPTTNLSLDGVNSFIELAKAHSGEAMEIKCPCVNCFNFYKQDEVRMLVLFAACFSSYSFNLFVCHLYVVLPKMPKVRRNFAKPGCSSQRLTKYEMDRQRNIERNSAVLSALGLKTISKALFGSHRLTKYEMDRQRNIERNSAVLFALGLKTMSNALFGSNLTAKKKTIKEGKSKMNCRNDDEEYQSCEDEEGMSSRKDVASSRFQANKAELEAKLKEQSQANVTDLLSREHVSVSVLGKRLVFLKEYGMLVHYLAMGVRLFRLVCCQVGQAVVLSQLLEGSNIWEAIPRTLCGVLSLGIPCAHALCVLRESNKKPEDIVHKYYKKQTYINTYKHVIYPMNGMDMWEQTSKPPIQPPHYTRKGGRPKKCRRRDADEPPAPSDGTKKMRRNLKKLSCRRCGGKGHNVRTCPSTAPRSTEMQCSQPQSQPMFTMPSQASQPTLATLRIPKAPSRRGGIATRGGAARKGGAAI